MGTNRFNHFKLGMGIVIKADKNRRGIGRSQVAMHLQLLHFLVDDYHIFAVKVLMGPKSPNSFQGYVDRSLRNLRKT